MPSRRRATSSSASSPAPTHPRAAVGGSRPRRSVVGPRSSAIPVLTPTRVKDPDFLDALTALAPDACPVVAYGNLIPPDALAIPRLGWINLHFSLLPAWRGAAPVQHAIMAGDEVTGASTFVIERGLDTGPVLGVMTETIRPTDTAGDLLGRLVDRRGRPARRDPGRARVRRPRGRAAAERGRLARPEDRGRRRPHRVDASGDRGRPARARLHARAGGVDDLPRRAAQGLAGERRRRRDEVPGSAASSEPARSS